MTCKYRLPCNWCEKFNKQCANIECKYNNACNHDWIIHHWYSYWDEREQHPVKEIIFQCKKCGETKSEIEYIIKEG